MQICLDSGSRAGCTWRYIGETRSEGMRGLSLNFVSSETLRYMIALGENFSWGFTIIFTFTMWLPFFQILYEFWRYKIFFSLNNKLSSKELKDTCKSTALVLTGDLNFPGTPPMWEHFNLAGNTTQLAQTSPEDYLDNNFVVHFLSYQTKFSLLNTDRP